MNQNYLGADAGVYIENFERKERKKGSIGNELDILRYISQKNLPLERAEVRRAGKLFKKMQADGAFE